MTLRSCSEPSSTRQPRLRLAVTLAATLAVICMTGCYERVVRTEGLATPPTDVHEPNLSDERIPLIDDILNPQPKPAKRK